MGVNAELSHGLESGWSRDYRQTAAPAMARRLVAASLVSASVIGAGLLLEGHRFPERAQLLASLYSTVLVTCAVALAIVRLPRLAARAGWIAGGLGGALSLLLATHDALVGRALGSAAIAQIGLLVSFGMVLMWGWREQIVMSVAAVASTLLVARTTADVTDAERVVLLTCAVSVAAVVGAYLFDRQRRRAFLHARMLERTSAEKEALLEAALDAILTVDESGRVVEANPAAARMFEYARPDLLGRPLADLVVTNGGGAEARIEDQLRVDAVAKREDASTFPVEVTMAPVRRNGARTFACTVRDISERKRVERQLQDSKRAAEEEAEIASALLYATETLATHLSQPYMLDRVTCRAVEGMGCDAGATLVWDERSATFALGGTFGVPPEAHAAIAAAAATRPVAAAARGPWPGGLVELVDPAAQGLVPPAQVAAWGVTTVLCVPIARHGDVVGVLCLAHRGRRRPFSARERRLAMGIAHATATALENARLITDLQTANRLKSEFVSTMSHELRTPLHVILGFAEMAYDVDLDVQHRRECLARIQQAGGELLAMIESTLEIGRLETGRDEVRRDDVSLPALLDELHGLCSAMPREREVALEWCERVPPARLVTDQRKLSIVLRNLIGNALKFTRRGRVRLDVRILPSQIDFVVSDTGIGIRPEDREAIFEMFRQADQSDSRRFGGTGLGLYIVRRYVEQLSGRIVLDSTPGEGSTFTVSIPRGTIPDATERAA
jgi:PAS domain S-box-containing protein